MCNTQEISPSLKHTWHGGAEPGMLGDGVSENLAQANIECATILAPGVVDSEIDPILFC